MFHLATLIKFRQMKYLYNSGINLYLIFIWIASLFNKKARLWIEGRNDLLDSIALSIDHESDYVWFHCASLGEFEQGRPVLEQFKKQNPGFKIILTFFSSSGYENKKNYKGADHICYMPVDTIRNAEKFIEYVNPKAAVFIKYEFWFNHLQVLHSNRIPVIFISAIFRKNQHFFRFYGKWFRKQLSKITYFFVQNKESQELLYSIGVNNVVVSGDTRFDRVYEISRNPENYPLAERFIQGSIIFMAGSTWPKDENVLIPMINKKQKGIKYIIVPHEIDREHINKLAGRIESKVVRYSENDGDDFMDADVLIIDTIGMLSNLYQYASIAYIGGGFGKGIHNILEAATFGMPVIFGPKFSKFKEARDLIEAGGAFSIKNQEELELVVTKILSDYKLLSYVSDISKKYVEQKKGATQTILLLLNTIINPKGFHLDTLKDVNMN
jgi:3-deoxy-D-manno-octulosonic-acid transferase